MNKEELLTAIAEHTSFSKTDSKKFLDGFVEVVTKSLSKGNDIQLIGFGSFSVAKREARIGRNPQTGAEIKIKASKAVKFTAGKALKDAVNNVKATANKSSTTKKK